MLTRQEHIVCAGASAHLCSLNYRLQHTHAQECRGPLSLLKFSSTSPRYACNWLSTIIFTSNKDTQCLFCALYFSRWKLCVGVDIFEHSVHVLIWELISYKSFSFSFTSNKIAPSYNILRYIFEDYRKASYLDSKEGHVDLQIQRILH